MSEKQKRKERERTGLSRETEELLRAYFDAFANLYGIMPLYRAFRIIRKQNPELVLSAFLRDGLKLERADDVLWELALAPRLRRVRSAKGDRRGGAAVRQTLLRFHGAGQRVSSALPRHV